MTLYTRYDRNDVVQEIQTPFAVGQTLEGDILLDLSKGSTTARLVLSTHEAIALIGKLSAALQQNRLEF